ncbi:OLC1v1001866C1 [Oldenlandia corymbosa var. corymbosa]|uniref:phenylalanine--tRNA ligase n=1 Tax=Oldenlandia corymbosa var. corymbosa TaxID=529605 RepID=A0AAV1D975_OLDCO|nr:OLC1v1001866C1 [Oldenlandia corymbosa var. corymbosa]
MVEEAVLSFLQKNDEIPDTEKFAEERGLNHDDIVNVLKSLHGDGLVDAPGLFEKQRKRWVLTDEGKEYAKSGSPEIQLFLAIPPEGIAKEDLQKKLEPSLFKIGLQQAIKNKWVEMGKSQLSKKVQNVEDRVKDLLVKIQNGETVGSEDIDALKRRKLITQQAWKGYSVKKGPKYAPSRKKAATDLTRENILRGDWKELEFKEYNFKAKGPPIEGGHLHPLLKVRRQVQMIFLQMGFEEMPTNNYVESSFWNFDALFQPQQHPARDSHDTFFLKEPSTTKALPEDYVERVKHVHEDGGYGSRGYRYDWSRDEANKNVLRTHTTAVSSRMLYQLAQKPFAPRRYYSIDRVFRNEAVDRTHLAEFHQIEGVMCDRGLSLGDLIGVLHDFFSRLGMTKLRFKPAYNPYTEPSMEIFSYHEGFKKWVEVGNSGMFRPEMLQPMGLPEDVRVIAWGLSLERPTMILYGINNIRDLFGHKTEIIEKERSIGPGPSLEKKDAGPRGFKVKTPLASNFSSDCIERNLIVSGNRAPRYINMMNNMASLFSRLTVRELVATTPAYSSATDVTKDGLSLVFRRWATKKTAGSSKNGRDSNPKYLGVKKFGGEVSLKLVVL